MWVWGHICDLTDSKDIAINPSVCCFLYPTSFSPHPLTILAPLTFAQLHLDGRFLLCKCCKNTQLYIVIHVSQREMKSNGEGRRKTGLHNGIERDLQNKPRREPVVLSGMTAVHTEGKSNPGSSLTGQTTEQKQMNLTRA